MNARRPSPPIAGGPGFCWHCLSALGGAHQRKGTRTWSVVADQDNNEHRVHKDCVRHAVGDGVRYLRDDGEKS